MKTVREIAEEIGVELPDCGDNSCLFGASGGMRTNGGCRCADQIVYDKPRSLSLILQKLCLIIKSQNARIESY